MASFNKNHTKLLYKFCLEALKQSGKSGLTIRKWDFPLSVIPCSSYPKFVPLIMWTSFQPSTTNFFNFINLHKLPIWQTDLHFNHLRLPKLRQSNTHIQYIVPTYAQATFHHYLLIWEIKLTLLALCLRNL